MTPAPDSQPVQVPLAKLPRPTEFDRLAVITIQGGGIYGLNLLGQLSYLTEKLKVVPVAVAGNSAGSVVAALFWAGYTPGKSVTSSPTWLVNNNWPPSSDHSYPRIPLTRSPTFGP